MDKLKNVFQEVTPPAGMTATAASQPVPAPVPPAVSEETRLLMSMLSSAPDADGDTMQRAVEGFLTRGANVNYADDKGQTLLIHAAIRQDVRVVLCLLRHGATVNAADNEGRTALYHAAQGSRLGVVLPLCEAGAEPLQKANDGQTPMDVAADDITKTHMRITLDHRKSLHNAVMKLTGEAMVLDKQVKALKPLKLGIPKNTANSL